MTDRRRRPIQHGSGYGYIQHRRRKETPCPECLQAHIDGRTEAYRLRDERAS